MLGNVLPLRYLFDIMSLEYAFKGVNQDGFRGFDIIEIGGGFGGMLTTFSHTHNINSYTIVDLPCVNDLVVKVLRAGNDSRSASLLTQLTPDNNNAVYSDLLISFWYMSEQKSVVVDKFIKLYVANAKRGYLQLNFDDDVENGGISLLSHANKDRYSDLTLFSKILNAQPTARLLPPPPCGINNFWGNNHMRIKWGPDLPTSHKLDPITGLEPNWG